MATKDEKMGRLSVSVRSVQPIPEWPLLPAFLKEKFPDYAEQIESYNAKCLEFFKRTGTIAGG